MRSIVNDIKTIRQSLGLKKTEAAQKAGISWDYYHRVETGRSVPSVLIAIRIAEMLHRYVETLDWGKEE